MSVSSGETSDRPLRLVHLVMLRFWSAIAWHAVMMSRALAQRGHRVWVAGQRDTPVLREAQREGLAVPDALRLAPLHWGTWAPAIGRLRRFLRSERVDAAFVHTGSGQLELHLARTGLPVALVRVRADARRPRADLLHRWSYGRQVERVAVTGTHMLTDQLGALGMAPERAVHLPPGIDLTSIERDDDLHRAAARVRIGQRHGLDPSDPWIGIVGRLSPVKGHEVLLRATARLATEGLRPRLLVVGEEKEVDAAQLRARAEGLGIGERVLLTGWVADPLTYAAALDVGVISSLGSEAVSRSALEFMALAVPVVASRVGILPEVVGDPDRIVEQGDDGALAAALARLLVDSARARACGEAGRERVRARYSLEVLGANAEDLAREARAARRL